MDEAEKLAAIRSGLANITRQTCWDPYDLAREVIEFIDGSTHTIFD